MIFSHDILELARNNVLAYATILNPEFTHSEHLRTIADRLHKIESGKLKRLIISCPPRHGKSFTVSQYFPAWFLAKNPKKSIIACSYGQELANDFGRSVRDIISSDKTAAIFGKQSVISEDSTSKKRFNTNQGGSYYAVGRGSPITGRGADVIIIDDLIKNEAEATSAKIRESMIEWYKSTLRTRLMPDGAIIVMATRWHQADLIGWLISQSSEEWEVLNFPAISKNRQALWPSRFNITALDKIRKEIGTRKFDALYQGEPSSDEGNIIKREWIKYYSVLPAFNSRTIWIQSWDLTFKGNDTSDFVVGQLWAKNEADYYLIDQVRGRFDFVQTKEQFRAFSTRYPQGKLKVIEDAANGAAVQSELKRTIDGIVLQKPSGSKVSRLNAISPLFEAGNVHIPNFMPWTEDYVEELVACPYGKNDDQVDATTQALEKLSNQASSKFISGTTKNISYTINTFQP